MFLASELVQYSMVGLIPFKATRGSTLQRGQCALAQVALQWNQFFGEAPWWRHIESDKYRSPHLYVAGGRAHTIVNRVSISACS
jgi:hypothetical protein